eukprot:366130-Chlamydomonas_euryale.AAC.31
MQMTREEIIASMRDDYAEDYFVSGKGKMAAYAEVCVCMWGGWVFVRACYVNHLRKGGVEALSILCAGSCKSL